MERWFSVTDWKKKTTQKTTFADDGHPNACNLRVYIPRVSVIETWNFEYMRSLHLQHLHYLQRNAGLH